MSLDLYESAFDILTSRTRWEADQRAFSIMRMDGLPRLSPPFKGCANTHCPVIDNAIRKRKPYLLGQLTAGDKLCQFNSLKPQTEAMSDAAADYYDFYTRNFTKFFDEMDCALDTSCLRGRGALKSYVDPINDYQIVDEAIDPMFILMPQTADDFEDADEFVHVRQMSVAGYKRLDARWDKDPATIAKIRGQPLANLSVYIQQKKLQEGITNTTDPNQIIVWEHWVKTLGGHTVYTYSPHAPDTYLRKPYGNPYKWQGKELLPFVSFPAELKDKGWYSPRGLGRLLAPEEEAQTKLLNEKLDAMTFYNRPVLTSEKEIANSANYRWRPGEVVAPGSGVKQLMQGAPPMSFDEEMSMSKARSEEIAQAPDFGITQASGDGGSKPRTAAENNRIAALQQTGTNYLGDILRRRLERVHRLRWGLIVQFKSRDFSYWAAGQLQSLPEQALHDSYLVTPDGSPDGWNRSARFQKAGALLQATQGNPNVNPEPITQELLNAYDGRMAQKAFVPTNQKGADEYEAQVMEINSVLAPAPGRPAFPATVKPSQDQPSRIKAIIDWLHACSQMKTPVDPVAAQRVQQNLAQRLQILEKQNPAAAKQIKQMLMQMEQSQAQGGGQPQQGQPPQSNGAPPPQAGQTATNGSPNGTAASKESISIAYKDAPDDIKRQMEKAAGFVPSQNPVQNANTPPLAVKLSPSMPR